MEGDGLQALYVQGSAKKRSPSLVNIVAAVACHLRLALPAAFTQPGAHLLADPCIEKGDCEIERGSEKGERGRENAGDAATLF